MVPLASQVFCLADNIFTWTVIKRFLYIAFCQCIQKWSRWKPLDLQLNGTPWFYKGKVVRVLN
jgi:hypothetical protein